MTKSQHTLHGPSRRSQWLQLPIVLISLIAIAFSIIAIFNAPALRDRIDATKTRAYSLSEMSTRLLAELKGDWTIALLISESGAPGSSIDDATRTQVDEVLQRYRQAAPNLNVLRIDPAKAESLVQFDGLLAQLNAAYAEQIQAYDQSLNEAEDAFDELQLFAQQYAAAFADLAKLVPEGEARNRLDRQAPMFDLLATQGNQVVDAVKKARSTDGAQPIPDYEGARSILHSALTQWSREVMQTSEAFELAGQSTELDATVRRAASDRVIEFQNFARRLAIAGDNLAQLPAMELSGIGQAIQEGDVAIILGPKRAAVIPGSQLFPTTNARETSGGTVRFDQRFRGEQVISSTIRSMLVPRMPLVVFVHAESEPMLSKRARQVDVFGAASVLRSARYEVAEWNASRDKQPVPAANQPVVWIIVTPPQRQGLQPSKEELALQDATAGLIEAGESVLLSVNPSLLPKFKQPDRWQDLASPFGLHVATGKMIIEAVRVSEEKTEYERAQTLQEFNTAHPIGEAVAGMSTYLGLPVPIEVAKSLPAGVSVTPIAEVAPSPMRWLEPDWSSDLASLVASNGEKHFSSALPIIVAASRPSPAGRGEQRIVVCGSGGWMLSFVSDVMVPIGGERMALANPGNFELLLAAVPWLAGMDELIAPGPMSQQIARLQGITAPVWMTWSALTVIVMPGCALAFGMFIWFVRRR